MSAFHTRARFIAVFSVVVLAACGSSSSTSTPEKVQTSDISSGLAPLENGFSFPNFGAEITTEQFDGSDLFKMFGVEACIDGKSSPCTPTAQAAAWARMVNESRQSGHCEGLVVQASSRYNEKATPLTAELKQSPEVTHGIYRAFATQFLPEVQDETLKWWEKSLSDIVNELVVSLKDGTTDYSMGVYSDLGGHAILPFAVDFTEDNLAVISVYDSNWPGRNRYVVIDLAKNKWFFSFSASDPQKDECAWSGGPGKIDLTPLESRTSATCPFCGKKSSVTKSMLLIRSATKDWSITTPEGVYSPASDTKVTDVSARAIRTATCDEKTTFPEFIIGVRSSSLQLTLPDDAIAYVSRGDSLVELKTVGKKKRKPVIIRDDVVIVDDSTISTTVSSKNLAAVVFAPTSTISIADDQIAVSVPSSKGEQQFVINESRPRQEITSVQGNVTISNVIEATSSVTPIKPILVQASVSSGLPPRTERDLNNSEYLKEVIAAAATTTTTTQPRNSTTTTTTVSSTNSLAESSTSTTTATTPNSASPSQQASGTTSPPSSSSSTSSTVAPTTTIAPIQVRIVIEDGEGGIRFATAYQQYPDSWGNPRWDNGTDSEFFAQCGPSNAQLCNGRTYTVPRGADFIFDWALYHDNYLFEMQCGTGASWTNPETQYGSGTEVRSIGRCQFSSIQSSKVITIRQR